MYSIGESVDNKYTVTGLCSDSGGMGTILYVKPIMEGLPQQIVLKYCKETDDESKARFSRETRYLHRFAGNSLVVQILDSNLDADPPYFVMQYYPEGDLMKSAGKIRDNLVYQESVFNKMLDCVGELHAVGCQHRDIKPQNFLVDGENIIISDFGLAKVVGAGTTFTMSHAYWGTQGYLPPEFLSGGGFKRSQQQSDIFMLGKSFYSILTGRDPIYLTGDDIHPALYHVIERCCDLKVESRYHSIAELRQDLTLAFDVILGRAAGLSKSRHMLSQIINRLDSEGKYVVAEVNNFLDFIAKLPEDERSSILYDLPYKFYLVLAQEPIMGKLDKFFSQYESFVEAAVRQWSYAETVAKNMKAVFERSNNPRQQAKALEIAVEGAIWANRFAAMDTCKDMIAGIKNDELGAAVTPLIGKYKDSFISGIEPASCQNDLIRRAIRTVISEDA